MSASPPSNYPLTVSDPRKTNGNSVRNTKDWREQCQIHEGLGGTVSGPRKGLRGTASGPRRTEGNSVLTGCPWVGFHKVAVSSNSHASGISGCWMFMMADCSSLSVSLLPLVLLCAHWHPVLCFCPVVNPSSAVLFLFTPHRCFFFLFTSVSAYSSQVFLFTTHKCFCLLLTSVSVFYLQVFLLTPHKCFCLLLTSVSAYSSQVFLFIPHKCCCFSSKVLFSTHSQLAALFTTTRPCFVSVFCQSQVQTWCLFAHISVPPLAPRLMLSVLFLCWRWQFTYNSVLFFSVICRIFTHNPKISAYWRFGVCVFFTHSPKLCLSFPPLIAKRFNESCSAVSKYRSWNDPRTCLPVFVDSIFFSEFDVNFQICSPVSWSYWKLFW